MISWLIISRSSRRLSARTLTICTRPGVRICFWATRRLSLGASQFINSVQPESFSQIETANIGIRSHFGRRTGSEYLSLRNDIGPSRDGERIADVVVRNEHSDAGPAQIG